MPDMSIISDLMLQAQYYLVPVYLLIWALKKYAKPKLPKTVWSISAVVLGLLISAGYTALTGGDFITGLTSGLVGGLESTQIWQVWKHYKE